MEKISSYCMSFAEEHSLEAFCDEANNVIIFKAGTEGYEDAEPIILQGHLDMVCQETEGTFFDFENDGLDIYIDGDFIRARGTTLGADNGIAVAMILAVLESNDIPHPPIEAVFTTDEEIGMIGAGKLSFDKLKGRKMINIDSEDSDAITVSCAGGSDFQVLLPMKTVKTCGTQVQLKISGLKGGHSGVEINNGRENASVLMGRLLNYVKNLCDFDLISINGGDKSNAIPSLCNVLALTKNPEVMQTAVEKYADIIKKEVSENEPDFSAECVINEEINASVMEKTLRDELIFVLVCAPNGVVRMSSEIENLVETSINLGILKTDFEKIIIHYALRSNKASALEFLEERLKVFFARTNAKVQTFGHYPPWEYNEASELKEIYKAKYKEKFGRMPSVEAIHAGLECGVFASNIEKFDGISIGPQMYDVHTPKESLSITSTAEIFEILLNVLKECR